MNNKSEQNVYLKQLFKIIAIIALFAGALIPQLNAQEKLPVERYAVYIASNNGGDTREVLRYAGTDANRLAKTMMDIGGVKSENSIILVDPPKADIDKTLNTLSKKIETNKSLSKRTEFIFYYSGHSDENALLLGNESYDYSTLKAAISDVPSDVHVVMLDSCFSGNFIRAKGGQRQKSFLIDDSTVVQGHAYLSSSSESEASQESDTIQASFFTHAMVTGLRGAADASGDNKVSLNELYYYAFNETLSQTERSKIGPQHPSYNITLVGSGDLVLTDISEAESVLVIPADTEGKYFIRTFEGILVSEVNKIKGNKVALALNEGYYSVTLIVGTVTQQSTVVLKAGEQYVLSGTDFMPVQTISGRARGGTAEPQVDITAAEPLVELVSEEPVPELNEIEKTPVQQPPVEDELEAIRRQALEEIRRIQGKTLPSRTEERNGTTVENAAGITYDYGTDSTVTNSAGVTYDYESGESYIEGSSSSSSSGPLSESPELEWSIFSIGLVPGLGFPMPLPHNVYISISPFMAHNRNVFGGQLAAFTATSTYTLRGVQAAGFMTRTSMLRGAQFSGFMNIAQDTFGAQGTGFMNVASDLKGIQGSGFMNVAGDLIGVQGTGFMNIAKKMYGVQGSGFANIATDMYGVQATGFLNVASGKSKGAQISGFLNIADEIDGAQIGVINIANKNSGAAIGILNFIKDGIMSPGVYWEKGNNLMFQYQGGTDNFYTTFIAGIPLTAVKDYYITAAGAGMRFSNDSKFSMDVEVLYKFIHAIKYEQYSIEESSNWEDHIPSLRVSLNFSMFNHLTAFAALSGDIMVPSWNKRAFSYWDHGRPFGSSDSSFAVYPAISAGVKF
ncbi:MAG TPA: caspase family protein [Treponemataceae bacterium]|nr:caspase family protein [Treponemataceae bacterium]HQL04474.1 caspase family protein [Treponemataceae bacterium]